MREPLLIYAVEVFDRDFLKNQDAHVFEKHLEPIFESCPFVGRVIFDFDRNRLAHLQ